MSCQDSIRNTWGGSTACIVCCWIDCQRSREWKKYLGYPGQCWKWFPTRFRLGYARLFLCLARSNMSIKGKVSTPRNQLSYPDLLANGGKKNVGQTRCCRASLRISELLWAGWGNGKPYCSGWENVNHLCRPFLGKSPSCRKSGSNRVEQTLTHPHSTHTAQASILNHQHLCLSPLSRRIQWFKTLRKVKKVRKKASKKIVSFWVKHHQGHIHPPIHPATPNNKAPSLQLITRPLSHRTHRPPTQPRG